MVGRGSSDVIRVLQGLSLVAEELIKTQGPAVAEGISRLRRHASDVVAAGGTVASNSINHHHPERSVLRTPGHHGGGFGQGGIVAGAGAGAGAVTAIRTHLHTHTAGETRKTAAGGGEGGGNGGDGAAFAATAAVEEEKEEEEQQQQQQQEQQQEQEREGGEKVAESYRQQFKEANVPSTPLARVMGFGALAAGLAVGAVTESVRRTMEDDPPDESRSVMMSDANAERLAASLCKMRGAALKLGQMLSIQDEGLLAPPLAIALEGVRQGANMMPKRQLHKQLRLQLGDDWRSRLLEFDETPIAAASIGQVHRAVLPCGFPVAMKIQYPGVADSIDSDLGNLKKLAVFSNMLPPGLYLDEIIKVGRDELALECDYALELRNQRHFDRLVTSANFSPNVAVPGVVPELSANQVLVSHLVTGVPIERVATMSQDVRNSVARRIMAITIRELFEWRFMQTDPNWGNFLYEEGTDTLHLIDFGAARPYSKRFVDDYIKLVWGAAEDDVQRIMDTSLKMGFLTGEESPAMMDAHARAGLVLGEPFIRDEPFDFHGSNLTGRLSTYGETFMSDRLTPPPREVYSLHRKLAGAFLACIKLKAVIPCRDLLVQAWEQHGWEEAPQEENLSILDLASLKIAEEEQGGNKVG